MKRDYLRMIRKIEALYPHITLVLMDAVPRLYAPVERVAKWPPFGDYIHKLAVSGLVSGACSLGLAKAFLRDGWCPERVALHPPVPVGKEGWCASVPEGEAIGSVIKNIFKINLKLHGSNIFDFYALSHNDPHPPKWIRSVVTFILDLYSNFQR